MASSSSSSSSSMASTSFQLLLPRPKYSSLRTLRPTIITSSSASVTEPEPAPEPEPEPYAIQPPLHKIQKRQSSMTTRPRGPVLAPIEPPNLEIGWKRTKPIKIEKPKGWVVADFLEKLEGLMSRGAFGSVELLAKVGKIVAERAREEAEVVMEKEEVDERIATELFRVLKLLEMEMEMVRVAVKEETMAERVETARARCRQGIKIALAM